MCRYVNGCVGVLCMQVFYASVVRFMHGCVRHVQACLSIRGCVMHLQVS